MSSLEDATKYCAHRGAETLYELTVPYLGMVRVCGPCRRALALRTVERPHGLLPVDCGRLGYKCSNCGGTYTSTDAMSCTCEGRKEDCRHAQQAFEKWNAYRELVQ